MTRKEKNTIKSMFKGYKKMSRAMRLTLESYNLVIKEEGKHYKIMRADHMGGFCTLAKTSSDFRAGKNFTPYLIKLIEMECCLVQV